MNNYLLVPVKLDALYTPHGQVGVEAMADFSQLPYVEEYYEKNDTEKKHTKWRDRNSDTAHISENIVAEPFSDASFWFKPGMHLHWTLPDALAVGRPVQGQDRLDFPAVPNRWLVKRTGGGKPEKTWVVESDYLWPADSPPDADAIAYPLLNPPAGKPAFRYLGRAIPSASVANQGKSDDKYLADYGEKLTALGYGEPTFHAFYPNCHSLFGLHDADFSGSTPPPNGLKYELFGWYNIPPGDASKIAPDPFAEFISDFNLDPNPDRLNGLESRDAFIRHLLNLPATQALTSDDYKTAFLNHLDAQFSWQMDKTGILLTDNKIQLDGMVCFAQLSFGDAGKPGKPKPVEVAVGNTGTEALSAYLASQMAANDPVQKRQIENQLEAVNLTADLAQHNIDLGPKFGEARHTKTFTAVPAGMLWEIRTPSPTKTADSDPTKTADSDSAAKPNQQVPVELPPELAGDLHKLNQLQVAYDRGQRMIQSLRRQIFSDWYKYMICCYRPPEATRKDDYPDIDQVKLLIENEVTKLNSLRSFVGEIVTETKDKTTDIQLTAVAVTPDGWNDIDNLSALAMDVFPPGSDLVDKQDPGTSVAQQLVDHKSDVEAATPKSSNGNPVPVLQQTVAAPRFWQPNEPVVLLVGEAVQSTARHGEDGLLECTLIQDASDPNTDAATSIVTKAPDAPSRTTDGQPWHPLMLEWQVGILPVQNGGNVQSATRKYDPNFVENNFDLPETRVDLSLNVNTSLTGSTSAFTGRCVITPNAHQILADNIDDYLVAEARAYLVAKGDKTAPTLAVCKQKEEANPTGPDSDYQAHLAYFHKHQGEITKWRDDEYQSNLVDGYLKDPVIPKTASNPQDEEDFRQQLIDSNPSPDDFSVDSENFKHLLAWYNAKTNGRTPAQAPLQTVLKARDDLPASGIQSQALGGFNNALLMHRQTLQLPIRDPLAFEEYKAFTETTVYDAVAGQNRVAPEPHFDLHPIRAGQMDFLGLRIVDTFGQILDVPIENVITTERLSAIAGGAPSWVGLPPRITQAARVNFRWLSAADDAHETNSHPATGPICGWLLPNNLDGSLMIYDAAGAPLGSINQTADLRKPPGQKEPPGPYQLPPGTNPHLQSMVDWICNVKADSGTRTTFMKDFLDVLETSLENIDPENFAQHQARSLLMGRPMALVRATVSLELQDPPATHQGWLAFRRRLQGEPATSVGFPDVTFPFRIGEHEQLNDGVVGYWLDLSASTAEQRKPFYAPQSSDTQAKVDDSAHDIQVGPAHKFDHSINDPAQLISLLIDPRGAVHCTSGVLPTKALSIPTEHYAKALAAINITFLTAPLLTDPGRINIPLPDEPGWAWSWLDPYGDSAGNAWRELNRTPLVDKQTFIEALPDGAAVWEQLHANKLVQLAPQPAGTWYVMPAARDPKSYNEFPTPPDIKSTGEAIKQVLDRLQYALLGPIRQDAHTIPPQEIREGWLQLSRVQDPVPSKTGEPAGNRQ